MADDPWGPGACDNAYHLGPCCACGKEGPEVRNVMLLDKKSPLPGRGWGCVSCGLPSDGAVAVLCDDCLESGAEKRWACRGYPESDGRVPIGELTGMHAHDPASHPEAWNEDAPPR